MFEARLQAELKETKVKLHRLRDRFSLGTTTVRKDLSLATLVPKWSGADTAIPLAEFVSSIEGAARVGKWKDSDKIQVETLKLSDVGKQFYNGCSEIHSACVTWENFKSVFRQISGNPHRPVPLYETANGQARKK
jgi:hypothetical protein